MKTPPTTSDGPWTILSLLKWTTSYFASHSIDNPRSTAEVLLAHVLEMKRIDLYLQYDRPMHADELKGYKATDQKACCQGAGGLYNRYQGVLVP
jgi:release factor glutamine methyltransferase